MWNPQIDEALTIKLDSMCGIERKDNRPLWDVRFMQDARNAATMATCPRLSVGCVLVRDKHILASGHNGAPRRMPHCTEVGCLMDGGHCIRSLHAEQNAINRVGIGAQGATCYVTHHPCPLCANMLINAGIVRVVYLNEYTPADGGEFFRLAGVIVDRIEL